MITIHKFQFDITDDVTITMPEDAKILNVETQNGIPTLWALVNTDRVFKDHGFKLFGTGHEILDKWNTIDHVATFQVGPFVWHMFRK